MNELSYSAVELTSPTGLSLPLLTRLSSFRCLADLHKSLSYCQDESSIAVVSKPLKAVAERAVNATDEDLSMMFGGDLPLKVAEMVSKCDLHQRSTLETRNLWQDIACSLQDTMNVGSGVVSRGPMFVDKLLFETKPEWQAIGHVSPSDAMQVYQEALALLDAVWPEAALEVAWQSRRILPLQLLDDQVWRNASCNSAPFSYVVTLSPSDIVEACEGILHECMHLRLHLVESITPLLDDPLQIPKYRHAWRPDLRPSRGVLLAAHAFFNIYRFYIRLRKAGFKTDSVATEKIASGVRFALISLVEGGVLTSLGLGVSRAMIRGLDS